MLCSLGGSAQLADGVLETERIAKEGAAGHEYVGAGVDGTAHSGRADAAIDLDIEVEPACGAPRGELGDLRFHGGDVLLATEAGVDRHDEHEVDEIEHMLDRGDRCGRIECHGRSGTELTDVAQRAVQVRAGLLVNDEALAAGST